jgi:hypothetical protein
MCSPVRCGTCGKTTWTGCGEHIEQVRVKVVPEQWCECERGAPARKSASAPKPTSGFWKIFGR